VVVRQVCGKRISPRAAGHVMLFPRRRPAKNTGKHKHS
jgi:diadenosine tetraphosphate (Ap4A) HIT family hydrolase